MEDDHEGRSENRQIVKDLENLKAFQQKHEGEFADLKKEVTEVRTLLNDFIAEFQRDQRSSLERGNPQGNLGSSSKSVIQNCEELAAEAALRAKGSTIHNQGNLPRPHESMFMQGMTNRPPDPSMRPPEQNFRLPETQYRYQDNYFPAERVSNQLLDPGGGQDVRNRATERPIRVPDPLIHVQESHYKLPEPIRGQDVPFRQQKHPIGPPETQFQYQGSYSNPPSVMTAAMAERDSRIDNPQFDFLANDIQYLPPKSRAEFEAIRKELPGRQENQFRLSVQRFRPPEQQFRPSEQCRPPELQYRYTKNHFPHFERFHGLIKPYMPVDCPGFDGLINFGEWLYQCEQVFHIHNISESSKIEIVRRNLLGDAVDWHEQFMERCRFSWPTWDEYRAAMCLRFGGNEVQYPRIQFNNSSQVSNVVFFDGKNCDGLALKRGDACYAGVVDENFNFLQNQTELNSSLGNYGVELRKSSPRNHVEVVLDNEDSRFDVLETKEETNDAEMNEWWLLEEVKHCSKDIDDLNLVLEPLFITDFTKKNQMESEFRGIDGEKVGNVCTIDYGDGVVSGNAQTKKVKLAVLGLCEDYVHECKVLWNCSVALFNINWVEFMNLLWQRATTEVGSIEMCKIPTHGLTNAKKPENTMPSSVDIVIQELSQTEFVASKGNDGDMKVATTHENVELDQLLVFSMEFNYKELVHECFHIMMEATLWDFKRYKKKVSSLKCSKVKKQER